MADVPAFLKQDDSNDQAPVALQANAPQAPVDVDVTDKPYQGDDSKPEGKTGWEDTIEPLVKDHPWLAGPHARGILSKYLPSELKPQDQASMPTQQAGLVASNDNGLTGATPPDQGLDQPTQQVPARTPLSSQQEQPSAQASSAPSQPQGIAQQPEYQQAFQQYQQDHLKQFAQEDAAFQHDLQNGHVTPKTYSDLFADKGTLGKIGTIFGLMMSGAGSGLARQPNMLLHMMDNEIGNDIEAQKQSKGNAQNFIRLNQQNAMNQAQIKGLNMNTSIQANTFARMQANRAALHHLVQQTQSMPIGSAQRAQAEQTLAALSQSVNTENYNLADQASANMARMKMMLGDSGGNEIAQQDPSRQIRQKQIMGFVSPEQSKEALKEVGATQNHVTLNQNALDSFDKVAALTTLSSKVANPVQGSKRIDAEWNPMMDKLTKDTEGRVTPITIDMMSALKPSLTDNRDTLNLKRQKLNGILNAGFATPTLDSIGVRVNKGEHGQQAQSSHPLEGKTASDGNGNRIMMQNGRWVPVSGVAQK